MPNRLAESASAYLQQHKNNPVDWYYWGPEALQKARLENKPIFLSIGYSSCHWCHVMEQESFSDPQVAEFLNKNYVAIKLDREERPDLDALYMKAVQAMTGQGGWPLNVFLTPELRPYFGGTYFPPVARYGQPPFLEILQQIHGAYYQQADMVKKNADSLTNILVQSGRYFESKSEIDGALKEACLKNLSMIFDSANGGFGQAPKFFYADALRILLREYALTQEEELLEKVEHTLTKMACGGIYDQVGGGFHRYSTDAVWKTPHFEKMLYDNALLIQVYTEAWQLTKKPLYLQIAKETADWALREMKSPKGFYSAIDADSEHHEGLFYTWTFEELESLGLSHEFMERYQVEKAGNFEGRNILHLASPLTEAESESFRPSLQSLLEKRSKERVWPLIDQKIQTSWNALMITALAKLGFAAEERKYLEAAREVADKIVKASSSTPLAHAYYERGSSGSAFLEDFAYFSEALLDLFAVTGDPKYFSSAQGFAGEMLQSFYDKEVGGFWSTRAGQEDLLVRTKEVLDSALPAPYHVAISVTHRLYQLTGKSEWAEAAEKSVKFVLASAEKQAGGFHRLEMSSFQMLHGKVHFLIEPDKALLDQSRSLYRPDRDLIVLPKQNDEIPALKNKTKGEYLCRAGTCELA